MGKEGGRKLVPREAPLLVLRLSDDLAFIVLFVVFIFAVPSLHIKHISIRASCQRKKRGGRGRKRAYLNIIPAVPILIADPLIPIRRLPVMDLLEETQRNLQPRQDLITRSDIPLLILILPALGPLIRGGIIHGTDGLIARVPCQADILGLIWFVVLVAVAVVVVAVVEVVLVVLLVVAFPAEVGRLVVFAGLLAEVFVVDGFAGAVDFVLVGLVAGILERVSG